MAITREPPGLTKQSSGTHCSNIFSSQMPRPLLPELCLDSESQQRAEWMDQSEAHSLIRARKQMTNYSMICHHLRTWQVFVPERIDTWREKGHIFRNSWMGNLFQVAREFIYAGASTDPTDSIFTRSQKMLSFLLINLPL